MGSFYHNITARGRTQQQVLEALDAAGVAALVSPTVDEITVIYPPMDGNPAMMDPAAAAAKVSRLLAGGPALAAMVHDSDVLMLALADKGEVVDEYNSCPSYFEDGEIEPPTGMDARALVNLLGAEGSADAAAVEAILRKGTPGMAEADDDDVYDFEEERHADLVRALGHPPLAPNTGCESFEYDEIPEGMNRSDFAATETMKGG